MNHRENMIRAYRRQRPEWIPIHGAFPPMMWLQNDQYDPDELEDILLTHPILYPGYKKGDIDPKWPNLPPDLVAGKPYTDGWGCVWETAYTGMVGGVTKHALADWKGAGDPGAASFPLGRAMAHYRLGELLDHTGRTEDAAREFAEAQTIMEQLSTNRPNESENRRSSPP